jgi:hypothetical protein
MEQRDDDIGFRLSQNFDNNNPDETPGLKQFSECECEKPIVEPISYVLPDDRFISLLHCKACNGLERYSITKLPNGENASDEELETVESLLEDIDTLERENNRLHQKVRRQSRRMRISQNSQFSNGEQILAPPEGSTQREGKTEEKEGKQQDSSLQFNNSSVSKTGKKILIACLVLGVGITGATIWRVTTLSSAAIILGVFLIILPIFFLTDGEIPQKHRGT